MSYQSITSKPCQVDDQHSPQNKTQAALLQGLPFRGAPVKKDTLYHPTKIPPSLTALVIVSLSDNTGPRLFLFLLELPALVCSSTPFNEGPSSCSVRGQTPQSIAFSLVLWRWFYLSQECPLSSLNTAVFLALSHYSSPAQSPSSSPLSPPAPEKKTDKTQVLSSFRWTSLIR